MKTQMTIFLLLLAGSIHGQKYFEATPRHNLAGDYELLEPLFEHESFDTTGKRRALYLFTDGLYFKTIFNKALESVLPLDSINKLKTKYSPSTISAAVIMMDPTGKVWDITFSIPVEDRKILTDEILYQLYQKISEIKIDMSKIKINLWEAVPVKDTYCMHTQFLYGRPDKEKKKK